MAVTAHINDGPRDLRDGEFLVDCAKARAALEASQAPRSEDRAAEALGISRSVLRRILGREDKASWAIVTLPNARSFAEKSGVSLEAIQWTAGEGSAIEQDSVAIYLQLWRDVYGLGLGPLVPLTMLCNDHPVDADGVLGLLLSNETVQLYGPSGTGKTHLLTHAALILPARGYVPVFAHAAEFDGEIEVLLDRAVSGVAPFNFEQLVRACGRSSRTPVVILDAVNECPSNLLPQFLAGIQKLRARFDFPIILSNQTNLSLPASLAGPAISLSLPDASEKRALVESHLGHAMAEDKTFSLNVISSAQDATVWAEVFAHTDVSTSRFALYESYTRRRLAGSSNVAIAQRALGLLAHEMRQSFVFSVPEAAVRRAIDRVISSSEYADGVRLAIERSGLLPTGQGRAAFRHEILQDFFAAEELLRNTPLPRELGRALCKPIHANLAEFVVGALASAVDVAAVLSELRSTNLLLACLSGRCGPGAQHYVEGECAAALDRLRHRYCAMSFDLEPDSDHAISVDVSRASPFSPPDAPYLAAAMTIFPDGRLISTVLDMIRHIDEHIEAERLRLRSVYAEKKIAWRARMFTALYCIPVHSETGELRVALQEARLGGFWRDAEESYERVASLLSGYRSLTPGQLYFLIEGFHAAYTREVAPPSFLYELAERAWSFHIYHLQLATTHMLTLHCHNLPEEERQRFIAMAEGWLDNSNPVMNGCVIDVLKVLGALDDQFTPEDARAEFEEVLAHPASPEANEEAFSIYCRMFDHPYDSAYGQAYYDLPEANRAALLTRAVQTDDTNSMLFSFLLMEVAKAPTPELVPALQRVASAPAAETMSVQESVSTFATAVAALAKISAPLPATRDESDVLHNGWRSMRNILYLLYTPNMTQAEYAAASDQYWKFLEEEHLIDYPMRIARDRWSDRDRTAARFVEWSKDRLLRMCRDVLAKPQVPRSWFETPHRASGLFTEHVLFALSILEMHGDRRDLPVIASLVDSSHFGGTALKAARAIESR
jgi:hypothetical protein